jgi:hypothetical protein
LANIGQEFAGVWLTSVRNLAHGALSWAKQFAPHNALPAIIFRSEGGFLVEPARILGLVQVGPA